MSPERTSIWIKALVILQIVLLILVVTSLYRGSQQPFVIAEKGDAGRQGLKGEDGYTPIKGKDYFDGQDGKNGNVGPAGPQGPPPTTEQIAIAITAYCEVNNQCQGPAGPQGEPGADGREIERQCRDRGGKPSRWEWRYAGDDAWQVDYYLPEEQKCPPDSQR